jgi:DNA-binding NarL/FixJ family response regulator
MTHVLVVEDHPLFRNALVYLIRSAFNAELHLACTAEEGLEILSDEELPIALVVMDMGLPGDIKGSEAVAAVRRARPTVPLLVVSGTADEHEIAAALAAGANGYVSKTSSTEEIDAALRRMVTCDEDRDAPKRLTDRQHEILRLLCDGLSNKEIGRKLTLSDATVKMHMTAVLRALGVATRTQAVLAARSLGLDVT